MPNQKSIFIIFMLFAQLIAFGQGNIIKGKVLDQKTSEPLPFVTIYCDGCPAVVSSDVNGEFEIFVLEGSDTLEFLYLGYEPKYIWLVPGETASVRAYMTQADLNMNEVIVRPKDEDFTIQMVRNAAKKLKENMRESSYLSRAYIKEIHKEDGLYTRLHEGYGLYYNGGFKATHATNKHKYLTYDEFIYDHIRTTDTVTRLEHPDIFSHKKWMIYNGPLYKKNYKGFSYQIDSISSYDNRSVYIVSFEHDSNSNKKRLLNGSGKLFIMPDDNYKVIKIVSSYGGVSNTMEFININNALSIQRFVQNLKTERKGKIVEIQRELFVNLISGKDCYELSYHNHNTIGVWNTAPIVNYSAKFWKLIDKNSNTPKILSEIARNKDVDLDKFFQAMDGVRIWDNSFNKNMPDNFRELFYNIKWYDIMLDKLKQSDPMFFVAKPN